MGRKSLGKKNRDSNLGRVKSDNLLVIKWTCQVGSLMEESGVHQHIDDI